MGENTALRLFFSRVKTKGQNVPPRTRSWYDVKNYDAWSPADLNMTKNAQKSAMKLARVREIGKKDASSQSLNVKRFEDFAAQLVAQEWMPAPRVPTAARVSSLEVLCETPKLVPSEQE